MTRKGVEPRSVKKANSYQFSTFPVVLQQQWEISRRYAMFATPIAYLIDEAGVIAREVGLGEEGVMQLVRPPVT